jgi:CheY-like chemotaxis protein
VLRRERYEIVTAADGKKGLQQWEATQPDMVLLDRILPKVDGFEACREIRHRGKTPVIMISARQSEDDRVRGLQPAQDACLAPAQEAAAALARRSEHRVDGQRGLSSRLNGPNSRTPKVHPAGRRTRPTSLASTTRIFLPIPAVSRGMELFDPSQELMHGIERRCLLPPRRHTGRCWTLYCSRAGATLTLARPRASAWQCGRSR